MKRLTTLSVAAALGVLLLAGSNARAGVAWTYDWTPSNNVLLSDNGNSSIVVTNQPTLTTTTGPLGSDVIAAQLAAKSTASLAKPDLFTNQFYSFTMVLKDNASGDSTKLTFTGYINGTLSAGAPNTTTTFASATLGDSSHAGTVNGTHEIDGLHIGKNIFDVRFGPYVGPGPGGGLSGSIGAHVTTTVGGGSGNPHDTPEPSSMALAGLGMGFMSFAAWRRKRALGLAGAAV